MENSEFDLDDNGAGFRIYGGMQKTKYIGFEYGMTYYNDLNAYYHL